jgi:hypothetical protein
MITKTARRAMTRLLEIILAFFVTFNGIVV